LAQQTSLQAFRVEQTKEGYLLVVDPSEKEISLSFCTALTLMPDVDLGNPNEIRLSTSPSSSQRFCFFAMNPSTSDARSLRCQTRT